MKSNKKSKYEKPNYICYLCGRMIPCGCTTELYGRVARGGCGHPPPPDGNQAEGREWRSGLRRVE